MFNKPKAPRLDLSDEEIALRVRIAAQALVDAMTFAFSHGLICNVSINQMANNSGYALSGLTVARYVLNVEPPKPGVNLQ